jgi:hypothetical protein
MARYASKYKAMPSVWSLTFMFSCQRFTNIYHFKECHILRCGVVWVYYESPSFTWS